MLGCPWWLKLTTEGKNITYFYADKSKDPSPWQLSKYLTDEENLVNWPWDYNEDEVIHHYFLSAIIVKWGHSSQTHFIVTLIRSWPSALFKVKPVTLARSWKQTHSSYYSLNCKVIIVLILHLEHVWTWREFWPCAHFQTNKTVWNKNTVVI